MKIGILGGAFDPPHNEHIRISQATINELGLDKVVLVPSGIQPHKSSSASANYRYEMAKLACMPYKNIIVDDVEINYPRIGYAADILPLLQIKYENFIYIMGGDGLLALKNWYRPDKILTSYPIAVIVRGNDSSRVIKEIEYYRELYNANITLLDYHGRNISSTEVRARLELDIETDNYLSDSVIKYIKEHNLYSNYKDITQKLLYYMTLKTFEHTKSTVLKAFDINQQINLPYDKVMLACLLHDISKNIEYNDKYSYAVPEDVISSPVMHAFQGVGIAEKDFGINDREVLSAIKYHTTGRARMSKLEILVFMADMIEDSRNYQGVERLREIASEDYILGFLSCVELLYKHLKDEKKDIYPLTKECYNYYITRRRNDY